MSDYTINERQRRYRAKRRTMMDTIKSVPCMDCGGEFPPECMDFDHVRGEKKFNIAGAYSNGMSLKIVMDEIDKCDIVCANCHRIRTFGRGARR